MSIKIKKEIEVYFSKMPVFNTESYSCSDIIISCPGTACDNCPFDLGNIESLIKAMVKSDVPDK